MRPVEGVLASLGRARETGEAQLALQRHHIEIAQRLRGDLDPEALAESALAYVLPAIGAQAGTFYLARPGQRLVLAARMGVPAGFDPPRDLRLGQGLLGRLAVRRTMQLVVGQDEDILGLPGAAGTVPAAAILSVPFHLDGRLKGLLLAGWARPEDAREPVFLAQVAESVALALDSAHARVRVSRLLEATRSQAVMLAKQQRELVATNDELARADRCKSEFLANMSHELRTPLNSMLIMSQVLAENREGNLSADQVETALIINRAGSELLLLINDILDMSRVEAGRLELQPETIDLGRLVADVQDLFRPVAERQALALRTTIDADVDRTIISDPLRVSQVLKNLLNNAFKFTERGVVNLVVRRPRADELPPATAIESCVAFAVTDTGIGMGPETLARVCEPFFQGDSSNARRYGGSGLGLTISMRLTELLGGRLTVRSDLGKGSEFVLALPTAVAFPEVPVPAPAAEESPGPSPLDPWAGRLAGRRVLLADTDMRTVFSVSHVLDNLEARVRIARSADEAFAANASFGPFDLVCLHPAMFAGREAELLRLLEPVDADPPACVWLGRPVVDLAGGPAVVLEPPLSAPVTARVLSSMGNRERATALAAAPKG
ncbi:MAG TPA: ATP-binding protein [Candidatus Krumholzibacteria bacterium]|nr:ATP-binding protein [Candidatus Krumholzibacteria bacterium]